MAVNFNVAGSRTNEYRFLPEDITIKSSLNGRHVLPDIEHLIADIVANGQHTPVVIRKDGEKPVLVAGFSRWRAVHEINKRKLSPIPIQLRCTYTQANEQEGFLLTISENRWRASTTELDDAYNIKLLMKKFALTEDQVALHYFPDLEGKVSKEAKKFVRQRLALLSLSPEMEKALIEGRIKGSAARTIAKLSQEQQSKLVEKAGAGAIKPPSKAKSGANGKVDVKKEVAQVIETGSLEFRGKHLTVPDLIVDWLSTFFPSKQTKIPAAE